MHGNEQIINELLGKYVHRLNKSTRQQFLVNLAARRCDDDSDSNSEGSSDLDEVGGVEPSKVEQVTAVSRPPRYAVLAPPDPSSVYFKPSSVNQCRSSLAGEQGSETILASVPVKKPLGTSNIPRVHSSPLLRRAESFTRKSPARENLKARQHDVSSINYDTNTREMVQPNRPALDCKLPKSLSLKSSSFTELDDDISVAASVMSTASIQSALYSTTNTSEDSRQNLVIYAHSRSKHPPRLPMRGSYVHATCTKSLHSKKFDMDDTSTVTTEATSMFSGISLSRSTSFESAASYEVLRGDESKFKESMTSHKVSLPKSSRRSELSRLKKLTLIRPTNAESMSLNPEKKSLDDFMSKMIEEPQIKSMGYSDCSEFSVADRKAMQVTPTRTSLKDLKSKRYGLGRVDVPEGNNILNAAIDRPRSTASVESQTASTSSTLKDRNRPMTAIAKRAMLRRHTTSRAQSATRTSIISPVEDNCKLTHAPGNTSSTTVGRVRPHSMSPLRTASSQAGPPKVDGKEMNRLSVPGIALKAQVEKKEVTPEPRPSMPIETNCRSAISSRAERRRSRSVSRSRTGPPSSPSKRLSPSLKTTSSAPSAINSDSCIGTPPRCAPKRSVTSTNAMKPTPTTLMPTTGAPDELIASSTSSSSMRTSLMKSALVRRKC